ncbi:hypothetical protein Moror_5632 [Moniliophthora roreri MCA 2997]|uniref:Uncharacterized protein n=1 Tax=Moniliophthora roreri (strain MCA 2997) TaxID=1381753 RepID=V2W7J0_MONRO|nr:hypothetical protein Moror_5632 [Moniliophthora roreri MCA 2997]
MPYQQLNPRGERIYSNLMSGMWAWEIADKLMQDSATHDATKGAMLVPIILGSDKMTVSIATGHQEYHPCYISIGNLTNIAHHAHSNSVLPLMFFPILKTNAQEREKPIFQQFTRQLFHVCLANVLAPLQAGMTQPIVAKSDYPEQVILAAGVYGWCTSNAGDAESKSRVWDDHFDCFDDNPGAPSILNTTIFSAMNVDTDKLCLNRCTARPENVDSDPDAILRSQELRECYLELTAKQPFTLSFPQGNINDLITPDILHQLIKGVFKDHLVTFIGKLVIKIHGKGPGRKIIKNIDKRISAVPEFPGL